MRRFRLAVTAFALVAGLTTSLIATFTAAAYAATAPVAAHVLLVPIHGTVDDGMAHLVERAVDEADAADEPLVLDVDTPGGLVSSAFAIRTALFRATVPTVAFVSERAFSAGALITLACRTIVMAPGSSIGAAEPIVPADQQVHEAKFVSALAAEFRSTAERNHRSGRLAAAMVDRTLDARPWKAPGAILTLTATEARRVGIADAVAATLPRALAAAGLGSPRVTRIDMSFGERLARFATDPEVSGILLSIGVLGLVVEMWTLHGIAAVIGVGALALYFGTHLYAGFGNGLVVGLAAAGVIGVLFELHVVPGHGAFGLGGILALGAAVALTLGDGSTASALRSLAIVAGVSVAGVVLLARLRPENAFVRRVAFRGEQGPQYVASTDFSALLGALGTASSHLRPAGVADFAGRRVDVLTDGGYVPAGSSVRVSRVEGARIFVAPVAAAGPQGDLP